MVVWNYTFLDSSLRNNNAIGGRLVRFDGMFASGLLNFVSIPASNRVFLPQAAWDGAQFWVAWLDHRAEEYPSQQKGNISAMRAAPDGSVVDPGGFAVASTPAPEDFPAVAALGTRVLFAYTSMLYEPPYLTPRILLRVTPPPVPGDVNGDDCVDDSDLLAVLFAFGGSGDAEDLNGDGAVDDADLLIVLFRFGSGC